MAFNIFTRTFLTSGLVVSSLLGAIACSDDSSGSGTSGAGGMAGAGGTGGQISDAGGTPDSEDIPDSDVLDELQRQLEELRKELATAGQAERATLLERIEELSKQLEERDTEPACGAGGPCIGLKAAVAGVRPLFEASCAKVFSCCNPSQATLALGPSAGTPEQCVAVLEDRMARGLNPTELGSEYDFFLEMDWPDVGDLATLLESGRAVIDQEAIDACAALIAGIECREFAYGHYGYGIPLEDTCLAKASCRPENWVVGVAEEGEPCNTEADYDECGKGLYCEGDDAGVCVRGGTAGDRCISADDCGPGAFCDIDSGVCSAVCALGAPCDDDSDCGEGLRCDEDDTSGFDEACVIDDRGDKGDPCSGDSDCKSSECRLFGDQNECAAYCAVDADCDADEYCEESICTPKAATGELCGGDSTCLDPDDRCLWASGGARCFAPVVDSDDPCPASTVGVEASDLCPEGQFCSMESDTCVDLVDVGEPCEVVFACGADAFCTWNGELNVCVDAADRGEDCSEVNCARGLYCESYDHGEQTVYVCLPREEGSRGEGEYCGPSPASHTEQVCESRRCRWANEEHTHAVCDAGLPEGAACDATEAWENSSVPNFDPCNADSYCRRNSFEIGDYSGTCAPRIPAGGVCSPAYPSFGMCEDDQYCDYDSDLRVYRCSAKLSNDERNFCPIKR